MQVRRKVFSRLTAAAVAAIALLGAAGTAFGAPVSFERAQNAAQKHLERTRGGKIKPASAPRAFSSFSTAPQTSATTPYFVFEKENDGFIIVAADDIAVPILGETDKGNFDTENLPPALLWLLGTYEKQIEEAILNGAKQDEKTKLIWEQAALSSSPDIAYSYPTQLLSTTWSQREPYNLKTPLDGKERSLTGCVATATAQIMKYWRHPAYGTGRSVAYTGERGVYVPSVNFNTYYNYDNMLNSYTTNGGTATQRDAISTLMYHVGVSVGMNYSATASGAPSRNVATALPQYFGYDNSIRYIYSLNSSSISASDWKDLVIGQIENNSPVYYAGGGSYNDGAHAFVIDGYNNTTDRFHINWGWGGQYDGFFALTALNPGSSNYSSMQGMIINIMPNQGSNPPSQIKISNFTVSTTQTSVSASIMAKMNYGADFSGKIGFAVMSGNNVDMVLDSADFSISNTYTASSGRYTVNYSNAALSRQFGAGMPFGDITLQVVIKRGAGAWTPVGETRYAQWGPVYTVTFDANRGAITPMLATTQADGRLVSLPTPTREGYLFNGWFTAATGGLPVTLNRVYEKNTTIYAQWTIATYAITYDLAGGAVSPANPESYTIETPSFTLNNPTKAGYTFAGWTGSNGLSPQMDVVIERGSTGDLHYIANWRHSVSFNLNGGVGAVPESISGVVPGDVLPEDRRPEIAGQFTRAGFINDGKWYLDALGTAEFVFGLGGTPVVSNLTLFLKWAPDGELVDLPVDIDPPGPVDVVYEPGLTLGGLSLPANFVWLAPGILLNAGDGQNYTAIYFGVDDNDGVIASVEVVVNVAKAAGVFPPLQDIDIVYTSGLTLGDIALPPEYSWNVPATTALFAGDGQRFDAAYEDVSGNYNIADGAITVNVAKAELTIIEVEATDRTYDGTAVVELAGGMLVGVTGTDEVTFTLGGGTIDDANIGTGKAVTTNVVLNGVDADNYTLAQPTDVTVNITAKVLAITGVTAVNREYNGTTVVELANGTLTGVLNGDAVTFTLGGGTIGDANIGIGKAATTNIVLNGIDADNYALAQPTDITVNIAAKPLTITGATAVNRAYDGTTVVGLAGGSLTGVVAGDNVTFALGGGTVANANAGANKVVTTAAALGGASASNYTLAQPSGITVNIAAKELTVTGVTATDRTYDGTAAVTLTGGQLAGVVAGDNVTFALGGGTMANANAGANKVVTTAATLGGASASNYTLSQPSGITVNIAAKALTVTGVTATDRTYDGTAVVALAGGQLAGVVTGDNVTFALGSGTMTNANAGANKVVTTAVTLGGALASNYTLAQPTDITVNIAAKALTVTGVTATDRTYDGTVTVTLTGGTLAGVVIGDAVTFTLGTGTVVSADTGSNKPVTTNITLTGADAGNYTLSQPTDITVSIAALPEPPPAYTVSVVNGTGGGTYEAKTIIAIVADAPPAGFLFVNWTNDAGAAVSTTPSFAYTVTAANVTLTANYTAILYTVAVRGGAGAGSYAAGDKVEITSGVSPYGQRFAGWESNVAGLAFGDATAGKTSFVMPAQNVTVIAVFKPYTVPSFVVATAAKSLGKTSIYVAGDPVANASLAIYDAMGNVVRKIDIRDNARAGIAGRAVAEWDMKDSKGRPVSSGTYLLKGVVKTSGGKREKVSVLFGVW